MKLFALCTAMLLSTASLALAQDYSNYAHDCEETGFNGDYSSTFGLNCGLSITLPQPQMSFLSLNNCVSWDSSNLVGHKGYVDDEGSPRPPNPQCFSVCMK